jgi:hypothetical protein
MFRRLGSRFALLAFALYHVPLFLNDFPSLGGDGFGEEGGLARRWGRVFTPAFVWVARHVFHAKGLDDAYDGDNGDLTYEWVRLLVGVVIAAVAAVAWTVVDRKRPRAAWVDPALRVLLRYSVALGLASYAVGKIWPLQFGQVLPYTLEQHVGELRPMRLLWSFMAYSQPYYMFVGWMELAVVLLLCFRRTTTLGALLCLPVMANVALLNWCYGVPVKLFSTMVVLSAAVLLTYDARRLVNVFVHGRASAALPEPPIVRTPWRVPLKILLVGGVLVSSVIGVREQCAELAADQARPTHGNWEVTSFVRAGQELSGTAEPTRWRRLALCDLLVGIRSEDDQMTYCSPDKKAAPGKLVLDCNGQRKAELAWAVTGDDLRLEGDFAGTPVVVRAKRKPQRLLTDPVKVLADQ